MVSRIPHNACLIGGLVFSDDAWSFQPVMDHDLRVRTAEMWCQQLNEGRCTSDPEPESDDWMGGFFEIFVTFIEFMIQGIARMANFIMGRPDPEDV
jgi:hypothetical protein